jgi:PAS domain S-box-containing protein
MENRVMPEKCLPSEHKSSPTSDIEAQPPGKQPFTEAASKAANDPQHPAEKPWMQRRTSGPQTPPPARENQAPSIASDTSSEQLYRRYQALFDLSPVGYLIIAPEGTIRDANRTAANLLKTEKRELIGASLENFIHPNDQNRVGLALHPPSNGEPIDTDVEVRAADGRRFRAHFQSCPKGKPENIEDDIYLNFVDISRETILNKELALINACLEIAATATARQPLLDAFTNAIKTYTECDAVGIRLVERGGRMPYHACKGFSRRLIEKGNALEAYPAAPNLCSYIIEGHPATGEARFTSWGSFFTNASSRLMATLPPCIFGANCTVCQAYGYESVALIPIHTGTRITGLVHVADRHPGRFPPEAQPMLEKTVQRLGMALDRLYVQNTLDRTIDELHHLSFKLIQAQEDEQRRIAMELHDQTGQDLSVLKLRTMALLDTMQARTPELAGKCVRLEAFIDKIIEDVRRLSQGLSPAALDILGLSTAVRAMLADYADFVDWHMTSEVAALDDITNPAAQIAVYRIIQEALHNTYKHAGARTVAIRSRRQEGRLMIEIGDDGCGFDRSSLQRNDERPRGLGLAAMRLRARMIGARFEYASHPERGTQIRLDLPLDRRKDIPR